MTRRAWVTLLAILCLSGTLLAAGGVRASAATTAPARATHTVAAVAPSHCPPGTPYDFPCRAVVNDYPFRNGPAPWRECGNFVFWRTDSNRHSRPWTSINAFASTGVLRAAADIDDAARRLGFRVDHTPKVGAIGVMERGFHGASRDHGHTYYIARVSGLRRNMLIEEYNWSAPHRYSTRTVPWTHPSWIVHVVGPARPHPGIRSAHPAV